MERAHATRLPVVSTSFAMLDGSVDDRRAAAEFRVARCTRPIAIAISPRPCRCERLPIGDHLPLLASRAGPSGCGWDGGGRDNYTSDHTAHPNRQSDCTSTASAGRQPHPDPHSDLVPTAEADLAIVSGPPGGGTEQNRTEPGHPGSHQPARPRKAACGLHAPRPCGGRQRGQPIWGCAPRRCFRGRMPLARAAQKCPPRSERGARSRQQRSRTKSGVGEERISK